MKSNNLKSNISSVREFVILFTILVFFPINIMGSIAFAYDAAGNRIKRELVITQKNMAPGKSAGVNENFYDSIGEKGVTFTSDGSGIVQISINDFNGEDIGHVSVFTTNGMQILNQAIASGRVSIDLSSRPQGVYILSVKINENHTTWKINKK